MRFLVTKKGIWAELRYCLRGITKALPWHPFNRKLFASSPYPFASVTIRLACSWSICIATHATKVAMKKQAMLAFALV